MCMCACVCVWSVRDEPERFQVNIPGFLDAAAGATEKKM